MAVMCKDPVDAAVARAGQSMRALITGGGVQGRGAIPGGEAAPVAEAGDVSDVAQQPRGAGGSDAEQFQ
jgi:hypothetical protein